MEQEFFFKLHISVCFNPPLTLNFIDGRCVNWVFKGTVGFPNFSRLSKNLKKFRVPSQSVYYTIQKLQPSKVENSY